MKFSLNEILTVIDKVKDTGLASFSYQDADTKIKIKGAVSPAIYPGVPETGNAAVYPGASNAGTPGIGNTGVYPGADGAASYVGVPGAGNTTGTVNMPGAEIPAMPSTADLNSPEDENKYVIIESPMVGTFYAAPSEDGEPFVKVGDTIEKGQPVGIVEAMKLMNEIEAELAGTVAEILVENGQLVEYGQPLMKILPRE